MLMCVKKKLSNQLNHCVIGLHMNIMRVLRNPQSRSLISSTVTLMYSQYQAL